jgi:hypothetical protein
MRLPPEEQHDPKHLFLGFLILLGYVGFYIILINL